MLKITNSSIEITYNWWLFGMQSYFYLSVLRYFFVCVFVSFRKLVQKKLKKKNYKRTEHSDDLWFNFYSICNVAKSHRSSKLRKHVLKSPWSFQHPTLLGGQTLGPCQLLPMNLFTQTHTYAHTHIYTLFDLRGINGISLQG